MIAPYQNAVNDLKYKTTQIIREKLSRFWSDYLRPLSSNSTLFAGEVLGFTVACMEYDNFDELITNVHGVVVKNWPLGKFCNQSRLGSRTEMQVLHDAWASNTARFEKLSGTEWHAWKVAHDSNSSTDGGSTLGMFPSHG